MDHFLNDEEGYDRWVTTHPHGIVLNQQRAGAFTVHVANCDHIAWFGPRTGTAGSWLYTKGAGKRCFAERQDALSWIDSAGVTTTDCRDCAPGFADRRSGRAPTAQRPPETPKPGVVRLGSVVSAEDDDEELTFCIGPMPSYPHGGHVLSAGTPIAQALLGGRVGDLVHVQAPGGSYPLRILRVVDPGAE